MASGIDRDAQALVSATAAEVSGVEQRRTRGIQLRHEGVDAARGGSPEGTGGRREVGRAGEARHVSMATGIDRDAKALVIAAAAEVAGVRERRVDDQRAAPIVSAYLKADLMRALELVTARDFPPDAIYLLVDHRLLESNLPILDRQDEVSLPVERRSLRSFHNHGDRTGVRAGSYDEVIFKFSLVAVVHQIHAGIDPVNLHFGVHRHIRAPHLGIVADEVVGFAGRLL